MLIDTANAARIAKIENEEARIRIRKATNAVRTQSERNPNATLPSSIALIPLPWFLGTYMPSTLRECTTNATECAESGNLRISDSDMAGRYVWSSLRRRTLGGSRSMECLCRRDHMWPARVHWRRSWVGTHSRGPGHRMISGPRWEGVLIDRVKVSNLVGHTGCHGKCEGCATDEVAILRTILSVRTVRYSTHNTDVVGGVIGDVSGGGGGGGVGLGEWRLYSKLFPALLLSPSSSPRHHHRDCHHRRVASHAAILHLL
jgi:hypothetical protein